LKVLTVVGARPQFIKAAPVSRALGRAGHAEFLVHTGQHYDRRMSHVFFEEMGLTEPAVNLEVGSGSHGWQTGQMLMGLEMTMEQERPNVVLVYGDTNSTIAAALAACKLQIAVAHVEAGLRSFNRTMPEEHNRVLTDHCADQLFCPTQTAIENLEREGLTKKVYLVGDTMFDAVLRFAEVARERSTILEQLGVAPKKYLLATLHRPYNTDAPDNLRAILRALAETNETVVFPVHPRTRQKIAELDDAVASASNVMMIEPVGYLDMLVLEQHARIILTDSGGMQKEAYFFGVPCVTLRPETEWVETVEAGWNILAGAERERILSAVKEHAWPGEQQQPQLFGDGRAAEKIVEHLAAEHSMEQSG
jgi:UDP-N-acetylglucosamine 2-epimerase